MGMFFELTYICFLNVKNMNYNSYKSCIDACFQCAAICYYCASMDLKESHDMGQCAQLDMECATICTAAAQLMCLGSDNVKEICKLCITMCEKCADECAKHDNIHCKECAKACQQCAIECAKI
jgi:hypothetical protein